jgi:hypothetical protein
VILSQEEVARLILAASTSFHRILLMTLYATGHTTAASRITCFRHQGLTILALPPMRWTDESHPTLHRCRTSASFSTNGRRCRMKHSPQRENSMRFGALTILLSCGQTDPFFRPLPPQPGRYSFLLGNSLGVPRPGLRPTAQSRHTSDSSLPSIEFA